MENYLNSVTKVARLDGIVLKAISGIYTVQSDTTIYQCSLRGNLKKEFTYSTSLSSGRRVTKAKRPHTKDTVAVGDKVRFTPGMNDSGVIEETIPRTSRFARSGFRGEEQTLVCNIDLVVVTFSCENPRPDPWKVDRFLTAAESQFIEPIIIGNKLDLVTPDEFHERFDEWRNVGYRVVGTSVKTHEGVEELREILSEHISAFVGPSGVGKSSLLNAIQPGLKLRTSEVGEVTHKGRHTTTAAQLIPLISGGWVADTPGLRQLELIESDRDAIAQCFPELRQLLGHCRFDDCRHESEPSCALKVAVENGTVSSRRFQSFLEMSK